MIRVNRESKRIDAVICDAFHRYGHGITIDVMDLPKLMDAGRAAGKAGEDIDAAIIAGLKLYRKDK